MAVQIRYFSVKTNKAKTFPLSSFYLPEKNVWPKPGAENWKPDLVNFVQFAGAEFVEICREVEKTVARMTELFPLGLGILPVLDVGLLLAVGDEPRVAVVVDLDDGGIEVRIGPGVILRSGPERRTTAQH